MACAVTTNVWIVLAASNFYKTLIVKTTINKKFCNVENVYQVDNGEKQLLHFSNIWHNRQFQNAYNQMFHCCHEIIVNEKINSFLG